MQPVSYVVVHFTTEEGSPGSRVFNYNEYGEPMALDIASRLGLADPVGSFPGEVRVEYTDQFVENKGHIDWSKL